MREFILMPEFDRQWERLGFDDNDLRKLEEVLSKNPKLGKVIKGTGGLRKVRFAFEKRGKSGSVRILYVDIVIAETLYLITAYAKGDKADISEAEKKIFKQLISEIKKVQGGKSQ